MNRSARFVQLPDGLNLSVDVQGVTTAPLAVLVSGAGAPLGFWPDSFVRRLTGAGYRVLRYDHRDIGYSDHFDNPYPISTLLDDLWGLIEIYGSDQVHIIGHSMGGYLGLLAATARPKRVASVAAISAGPTANADRYEVLGLTGPTEETWNTLLANQPSGRFSADLPGWMRSWRYLNGIRSLDNDMAEAYTRLLYQGDPRNAQVADNHIHAMGTLPDDFDQQVRSIRMPLLVLHGTEDPLVPSSHGRVLAECVQASRHHPLDGAGHMFFNKELWREIGNTCSDFLRSLDRGR